MKAAYLLIGCLCAASRFYACDADFITITNDGSGYGLLPGDTQTVQYTFA